MGGYISSFICNVVGFTYPTYASFKAIENPNLNDDKQWLTYWIVYSVFTLVESLTDIFISWIPFYFEMKLLFLILLQIPQLKLAAAIYLTYIQPYLKDRQVFIDSEIHEEKENLEELGKNVIPEVANLAEKTLLNTSINNNNTNKNKLN